MKKKIQFCINVLIISLLIFSVISAIIIVGPSALGYKRYKINSSSMSTVLKEGDIIYVMPIEPAKLRVGDIITFYKANSNLIITHRISRIDLENKLIYTKGDMNETEDAEAVLFENVIGRYANFKIPHL